MSAAVYAMCAVTSVFCCYLLARQYSRTRARLLLWSALCFGCFGISNIILYLDLVVYPGADLLLLRTTATAVGAAILLVGLIWETG